MFDQQLDRDTNKENWPFVRGTTGDKELYGSLLL